MSKEKRGESLACSVWVFGARVDRLLGNAKACVSFPSTSSTCATTGRALSWRRTRFALVLILAMAGQGDSLRLARRTCVARGIALIRAPHNLVSSSRGRVFALFGTELNNTKSSEDASPYVFVRDTEARLRAEQQFLFQSIKGSLTRLEDSQTGALKRLEDGQTAMRADMALLEKGLRGDMTALEKGLKADMGKLASDITAIKFVGIGALLALCSLIPAFSDLFGKLIAIIPK